MPRRWTFPNDEIIIEPEVQNPEATHLIDHPKSNRAMLEAGYRCLDYATQEDLERDVDCDASPRLKRPGGVHFPIQPEEIEGED